MSTVVIPKVETAIAKGQRLIGEELKRLKWKEGDLQQKPYHELDHELGLLDHELGLRLNINIQPQKCMSGT